MVIEQDSERTFFGMDCGSARNSSPDPTAGLWRVAPTKATINYLGETLGLTDKIPLHVDDFIKVMPQ